MYCRATPAFTSGFLGLRTTTAGRGAALARTAALAPPRTCPVRPMAIQQQPGGAGSIDFGKVNMSSVGENLAGLVFTPESGESTLAVDTRCDYGYTQDQEDAVNRHINVEYTAMYAYHAIWAYFNRDTVALPGFAKYFNEQSLEERSHAHEFMEYQNKRGGKVELLPIAVPEMAFDQRDGTSDAVYAMDLHLQLEKFVYLKLTELHKVAEAADDPQMCDYIEGYLTHQVDAIKVAADYVAQLKRVGTPHGVYHINLQLSEE
jgi:ferritin heavy chain